MASGGRNTYRCSFEGVAGAVSVKTCPFQPKSIKFWVDNDWGYKSDEMAGDAYIGTSGADTGVTITSKGFDVDNGADINQAGVVTYFECMD